MKSTSETKSGDFLERISRAMRENSLVNAGETVMVACSGGVDSMVLLDVMDRLGRSFGFSVAAAHLDHSLRGPEGQKDQKLVAQFCRERKIFFTGGREDVRRLCQEEGLSLQDGARRVRYAFLEESLRKIRGHKIATAHHADDQVETILMRLLRGTGPGGLRGIPVMRGGVFIRPFISEWKVDIVAYAREVDLPFREDPGNRDPGYHRNRIRNELLPSLEAYNPRVKESIFRFSRLLVEEGEALDRFIDETLKRVEFKKTGEEITINREALLTCHPFVIKEIIRRALRELHSGYGPDSGIMLLALDFVREAKSGKRLELPAGRVMGRDFDEIFFRAAPGRVSEEYRSSEELEVSIEPGWQHEYRSGADTWTVQVDVVTKGQVTKPAGNSMHQYFDRKFIRPPVRLRMWRSGDTLDPIGMKGRKKISDLLTEERVARRRRNEVVLLEDRESVLWVVGVRRSRRAMIIPGTREVVSISISTDPGTGDRP
jgi:tRNA(Ile)-lysidine synthase